MAAYLLDADALIDFFKGVPSTVALFRKLHDENAIFCTCDTVIAEIHAGLHPSERARGEALLDSLRFFPTSRDAAKRAGQWRYEFRRRGRQLATTDCLIAAIAFEFRATVVTGNTAHFPMPELALLPLQRQ